MKRLLDIFVSLIGLIVFSPILIVFMTLIYLQDKKSPFYIAPRVGKNNTLFKMFKLRSMVVDADKSGVDSTSANDTRITKVGHLIRKYKLDEITQLWNVLIGDMSLVGPRPNVKSDTDQYSNEEKQLLSIKPGITDLSSIIFSDEGDILANKKDPDLAYSQLIRPWKSRLGLIYIKNSSVMLDIRIIIYTVLAIVSKQTAIDYVIKELNKLDVSEKLIQVCRREEELAPYAPPGMNDIITN